MEDSGGGYSKDLCESDIRVISQIVNVSSITHRRAKFPDPVSNS
jgi:hypothetical protein